jgi:membrane fusion protein (multidrug efflux system)
MKKSIFEHETSAIEIGAKRTAQSDDRARPTKSSPQDLFREEALQHYAHGGREGDMLRLSPLWARRSYWVVVALLASAILFATFGRINEYASGRAIVRAGNRIDVSAVNGGVCSSVDVKPGDRVASGQVLARFYAGAQAAELERIDQTFNLLLVELLTNPADQATRQSLAQLRTEREWARSRLEEQHQRAPGPGVVTDVRVRRGQFVEPGEVFMTLSGDSSGIFVLALLPGRYGPEIHEGQALRMELDGYPLAHQRLTITRVSNEVLGPGAARRILGRDAAEDLSIREPVLVVSASLPGPTFKAQGTEHTYRDGMQGRAEVRIRSERIVTALIPGWRDLAGGEHE